MRTISAGDHVMVCDQELAAALIAEEHAVAGRVVCVRSESLVWVRDFLGRKWALPAHQLKVISLEGER